MTRKRRKRLRRLTGMRWQQVAVDLFVGIVSNLITDRLGAGDKKGSRREGGSSKVR